MKSVLITEEYFSCCWAVLTNNQSLFCFSPCPGDQQAEVTRCWEGTEPGELTQADVMCSNKSWGKGGVAVLDLMKSCFPGDGWSSACQKEVVNELLTLLCSHEQLLLYLLTSFILIHGCSHCCVSNSLYQHNGDELPRGHAELSCPPALIIPNSMPKNPGDRDVLLCIMESQNGWGWTGP